MLTLIIFINKVYIQNDKDNLRVYQILLIFGILYPWWYDTRQLFRSGFREYFSDMSNYFDMLYIYGGIANVIL